jgi:hypothetical protein
MYIENSCISKVSRALQVGLLIVPIFVLIRVAASDSLVSPEDITVQNGVDDYTGQENTHMNRGGWSYDDNLTPDPSDDVAGSYEGFDGPGMGPWTSDDDIDQVSSSYQFADGECHFRGINLIAFRGLDGQVPAGYQVGTAKLVLNQTFQHSDGSNDTTLEVHEALMPWDSESYWLSWGNGGTNEGYEGIKMGSIPWNMKVQKASLETAGGSLDIEIPLESSVIQGWLDDPSSNHGVVLRMPDCAYNSHSVLGGQNGPDDGRGNAPKLVLTAAGAAVTSGAFTAITAADGSLQIEFTGEASTDYQLQSSSDPVSGTWDNAGSAETSDGSGSISFSDQAGSSGMYRTVEQGEEQ